MNVLGNDFLLNDWSRQGYGRESFNAVIKEMNENTELVQTDTSSIAIGHYLGTQTSAAKEGRLRFRLFSDGLHLGKDDAKPLVVGIDKSAIKATGISEGIIYDIIQTGDILQAGGQVMLAGKRAISDLAILADLKGENMMVPTIERAAIVSKFLPEVKKVACVVRHSHGLSRCFAVRAATFTPYSTEDLMAILDGLSKAMIGKGKTDMVWEVNHTSYTATILLQSFEKDIRKNYGIEKCVPFIEVQDSSIGDSSFTVRTGIAVDDNKVILEEKGWNHNAKESQVEKIISAAKDTLAANLKDFVSVIAATSVKIPNKAKKGQPELVECILDHIYEKCDFKTYLGQAMWNEGRRKTADLFRGQNSFTGGEVITALYSSVETKTVRNMRAMANVPGALKDWCDKNNLTQLTFSAVSA